jgi:hypothetical protein
MQQVRGQIYGQLGYGKFLPGYFEYAGRACVREVLLSVARPGRGYVCWARVKYSM